ncbi:MAG: hypothetical protein Alpg2KO_11530 [Alphaproteobacteria bacterium]
MSNSDAETSQQGQSETQPAGTVRGLVTKAFAFRLPELLLLSLFINALSLAVPVFVLQVYDRVIFHAGLQTLQGLVIGVTLAIAFDFILRLARARLVQRVALGVDIGLSKSVFGRIANLPLRVLEGRDSARWMGLNRDVETVRDTVSGAATVLAVDLIFLPMFVIVIAAVAPPLLPVVLVLIPVFMLTAFIASAAIGSAGKSEQEALTQRDRLSAQLVAGRSSNKMFNLGPSIRDRWEGLQASSIRASIARGARTDLFANLTVSMGFAVTVCLTTVGALSILNQGMTIGGLIAANMLAARIVQPMSQVVGLWKGAGKVKAAARRLNQLLAEPEERQFSAIEHTRPKGIVKLEQASFRYDKDSPAVVDGISATFRPGAIHGIVGINGAGKSTLLKLIQGLYHAQEGRVLLDGQDIEQFGRHDLSRWVGFAPQDPFLLAGTIRDNIGRFRDDVDDAHIMRAAEQAGAAEFIAALQDGYGTELNEGGLNLSSGQRQKIALARTLLDDPPVLLLDEPTSHLDPQSEAAVLENLAGLKDKKTIICVSHSPQVLGRCDNILLIEGGRIVQAGPAAQMLAILFRKAPQPEGQPDQTKARAAQ